LTARVDVWFGSLDAPDPVLRELRGTLSADELDRAGRFHFARDRDRFVVGRGLLRALLGAYTGAAPAELQFDYSPHGKPRLRDRDGVSFNVSHSENRAVFAFTPGAAVGVDIEVLDSRPSDALVAGRFFSPTEVRELLALPLDARPRAFLTCWTRKEAFIKARGEGLSLPLQDFDVTLTPGVAPKLLRTDWHPTEPSEWLLFDLSERCPGCIAALAVRAERAAVSFGELELSAAGLVTHSAPSAVVAAQT
jgi:4'-phosphopantetheinyl transferase